MKRLFFSIAFFFLATAALFAQEPTIKCLLIGIADYNHFPLEFVKNDVATLGEVLKNRYIAEVNSCINTAVSPEKKETEEHRTSIADKIEKWSDSLREGDTAILYLSGHGVKDFEETLYLAMLDFDGQAYKKAAIKIDWIYDLFKDSRAGVKMLILDTCFSGAIERKGFKIATSEEVNTTLAKKSNIITIASCRSVEKSWIWEKSGHSLFSYWLIEALKGNADADGDRKLTCEELVSYLKRHVPRFAKSAVGKTQNPVVYNEEAGKDFALSLKAVQKFQLEDDIANQIRLYARTLGCSQIDIPDFTLEKSGRFDGYSISVARALREKLVSDKSSEAATGLLVFNEKAPIQGDHVKGPARSEMKSGSLRNMKIDDEKPSLLVEGKIDYPGNGGANLRITLVDRTGKHPDFFLHGVAFMDTEDLAMAGISGVQDVPSPSPPEPVMEFVSDLGFISQAKQAETEWLRKKQKLLHPIGSSDKSLFIRFRAKKPGDSVWDDCKTKIDGNKCYVLMNPGEEFEIVLKNNREKDVFARVFVDGRNTLAQPLNIEIQEHVVGRRAIDYYGPKTEDEKEKDVPAPEVDPAKARAWYMEGNKEATIRGFQMNEDGDDLATLRKFIVDRAEQSVGGSSNQTGQISIAFYEPMPKPGSLQRSVERNGAKAGEDMKRVLPRYKGDKAPGDMIANCDFYYVTPDEFKKILE